MVDLRIQVKNKTKKPTNKFLGIAMYTTCAKFQGKILNSTLVETAGILRFLKKKKLFFC